MVRAGLGYLAAADPARLPAATQAERLRELEQADAAATAARASFLSVFTTGQGYAAVGRQRCRGSGRRGGGLRVATQGHVLFAADFLATLAVEATIHHLDLAAGDKSLAGPAGPGLAVTRETLDGALGQPVPVGWDDVDYALKATGRAELTDGDRASLGVLATRFPLLG